MRQVATVRYRTLMPLNFPPPGTLAPTTVYRREVSPSPGLPPTKPRPSDVRRTGFLSCSVGTPDLRRD
jgi:hypothetical protein